MRRGKTVAFSHTTITFPRWHGTNNVSHSLRKTQTIAYTRKYPPVHLLCFYAPPPPPGSAERGEGGETPMGTAGFRRQCAAGVMPAPTPPGYGYKN